MFEYIIKRILIFIPTLFIISLMAFALSKLAPGDPVEMITKGGGNSDSGQLTDMLAGEKAYKETAERLGLNLPAFYFGLSSASYPDTLHNIVNQSERDNVSSLVDSYGNWPAIAKYYETLKKLERQALLIPGDSLNHQSKRTVRSNVKDLYINNQDGTVNRLLKEIDEAVKVDSSMRVNLSKTSQELLASYASVKNDATPFKKYIPSIKWYGMNNQYHNWITNFFMGDFGYSYLDNRPVANKMWDALRWTLLINFISILLAYLLSIPLGISTAVRKDSKYDRITTTLLFILYSLPSFWIATLLIVFFTSPEYGTWLNLFPSGGISDVPKDAPFMTRFFDIAHHLMLPILCVTYGSLAFIARQMRGGMLDVIKQDYIRTAKAKGLDQKTIIWKHAFRNSLFPIITMFAYVFPAAIAGSVVIEVIFGIPGMGELAYKSIIARDWPVVYTVLMFAAILTMIGNLVADMLYAVADPRVTFASK